MKKVKLSEKTEDNLRNFLNITLKDIMAAVEAECGSLFIYDYNNELVLDSLYNSSKLNLKGLRKRIGEGIAGKVVDIKTAVLVKDINKDLRFQRNGFSHYRTNSFISVPLFSASRGLIGVINIADKKTQEAFSEKDLNITILLCKHACITVDSLINYAQIKQEKEAGDKQNLLLEKYASVGKLAAGVVHEVNNPLDGIIRYTNILLGQLGGDTVAREYLLEVKNGLNRIAKITRSLLEFSHQVNSHSSYRPKKYVDIQELIDESLDLLKGKLSVDIEINKRHNTDLPRILDLGLSSVVTNLIKNALDAMPSGGTLDISTGMDDASVKINFKDKGEGISQEIIQHIFKPFFTTKDVNKGSGLGLAICNEIIKKYDGRIDIESSLGKGSNFTVIIPKKHLESV